MDLWREAFTASVSQIVAILATFGLAIILTRSLPPEEVGVYYFLYAAILLATQVNKGLGNAIRKRVSESEGKQSSYFWTGMAVTVGYGAIIGLLALGVLALVIRGFGQGIFTYITPALLGITFLAFLTRGFLEIAEMYLAGLGYPGRADWIGAALPSTLTALLSLIVTQVLGGGVSELLYVLVVSYIICTLAIVCTARPAFSTAPSWESARSLFDFARWSVPNTVLNDFYHRFDTLVLGVLIGAVSVGYYDASVRMVTLGFAISFGLGAATSVNVSGRYSQGLPVAPVLRNVTEAAAIVTFPLVVGFALVGDALLVGFYGAEYELAFYYLVGLAAQQVLQGYRVTFEGFFEGMNEPRRNVRASAISVGVNVLTAFPLVLWIGGIGVVISTLIADIARLGVFRAQAREQLGEFSIPRLVPVQATAAVALFLGLYPVLAPVEHSLGSALATMGGVLCLYFGILAVVSPKIRHVLQGMVTGARE